MASRGGLISGKGSVKDVDKGMKKVVAAAKQAKDEGPYNLVVGILAAKGAETIDGDLTVAQLGEIHEFGLGVPQRSFIGSWFNETVDVQKARIRKLSENVFKGKIGMKVGLSQLGALAVAEIQKRFASPPLQALAQSTIDRKGSSVPLIDTGVLRSSITFQIRKGASSGGDE